MNRDLLLLCLTLAAACGQSSADPTPQAPAVAERPRAPEVNATAPSPASTPATTSPAASPGPSSGPTDPAPAPGTGNASPPLQLAAGEAARLVAQRPYVLLVPPGANTDSRLPLVLFLHGYGASGPRLQEVIEVPALSRAESFIAAIPEGSQTPQGRRFWNATPACCNFLGSTVDDVRYLAAVIEDARARAPVDPERIYVIGFSNGGFMAHRLACELSDRIAGVASIAGMVFLAADRCRPAQPIAVLQVHGDADDVVPITGGHTLGRTDNEAHPSAQTTIERWARHDGCRPTGVAGEPIDLEPRFEGAETTVTRFEGCRGGGAELWTVHGGNHFVALRRDAIARVYEYLRQFRLDDE